MRLLNGHDKRGLAFARAWHGLFWQLIYADWSVADIAEGYGLTEARTREILDEELLADHEWLTGKKAVAA